MDEIAKSLGPWPILQFMFGVAVLGFGVYMIVRGLGAKHDPRDMLEDKRQEWEAYEQLRSIEDNIAQIAAHQLRMLDRVNEVAEQMKALTVAINALSAAIWNRGV